MRPQKTAFLPALAVLGLVLASPLFADDKKVLVDKGIALRLQTFDQLHIPDPGEAACADVYKKQVARLRGAYENCLKNPVHGSPLEAFNSLPTNKDVATFCGKKTMQKCVDDVLDQQHTWCTDKAKPILEEMAKEKKLCLECEALTDKLEALMKQAKEIELEMANKKCPPLVRRLVRR